MSFWRQISPRGAVADLAGVWRSGSEHRWPALFLAVAATSALMYMLLPASQRVAPERPRIVYITSYAPDRTDAEIISSNQENQARKDEFAKRVAEAEERRKDMYRTLGRATGVDVDAMEEQIARDAAAERPSQSPPPSNP
ncbi:hypothetical protein GRI97_18245 [Altererythrobacter xixiisoli]|uniref:Uncharacterized protein n=1 Tax=Croceibacterium xixiisoli TaxID=1476466 RepID=A0A6I4U0V6_9SPHN|nr:hypothetical protein [Croceibacterium xixiisoli]MXP00932.1 hypothetical protein [Croceibacterium xixiisoli]